MGTITPHRRGSTWRTRTTTRPHGGPDPRRSGIDRFPTTPSAPPPHAGSTRAESRGVAAVVATPDARGSTLPTQLIPLLKPRYPARPGIDRVIPVGHLACYPARPGIDRHPARGGRRRNPPHAGMDRRLRTTACRATPRVRGMNQPDRPADSAPDRLPRTTGGSTQGKARATRDQHPDPSGSGDQPARQGAGMKRLPPHARGSSRAFKRPNQTTQPRHTRDRPL